MEFAGCLLVAWVLLLVLGCSLARLYEMPVLFGGACLLLLGEAHHQGFLYLVRIINQIGRNVALANRFSILYLSLALNDEIAKVYLVHFLGVH